jgi:mono/diheme cytochrome c family protein
MIALLLACSTAQVLATPRPSWERMQEQDRAAAYSASTLFPDGAAMQVPPDGAVPFAPTLRGRPPVDDALLDRGEQVFGVYCAPCHGVDGRADTPVAERMKVRRPPALVDDAIRSRSDGEIHDVIRAGYGLMPSYAARIDDRDAWAAVAWVRVLQVVDHTDLAELSPEQRATAERELP